MCGRLGTIDFIGKGSKIDFELLKMNELTGKICSKKNLDEISNDMKKSKEEIIEILFQIKDYNLRAFRTLTGLLGPKNEVEEIWGKIDKLKIELRKKESMDTSSELSKKIENLYEELKAIIMR